MALSAEDAARLARLKAARDDFLVGEKEKALLTEHGLKIKDGDIVTTDCPACNCEGCENHD